MKKIVFGLIVVCGTGIDFVIAQGVPMDQPDSGTVSGRKLAQKSKGPSQSRSSIFNGFEVMGEADHKVKGRFEHSGQWVEIVGIAHISEEKIITWDAQGNLLQELADEVHTALSKSVGRGNVPQSQTLSFTYGKKNRFAIIKFSKVDGFYFPLNRSGGGLSNFSSGIQSSGLFILPISAEKTAKTGSVRCLFTGAKPTYDEISWTGKSGGKSSSGKFVIEEVRQFNNTEDFLSHSQDKGTFYGSTMDFKHGVSTVSVSSSVQGSTDSYVIELLDKSGKVLKVVNKDGDLRILRTPDVQGMSLEDATEYMRDMRSAAFVMGGFVQDGTKQSYVLTIPTKKLDRIDRLRITRTPRVLVDFVDLPLDPK